MNLYELCERDVVNLLTGENMGSVDDINFDELSAQISHIVLYGKAKFFGLLGREEDILIPWSDIAKIGTDVLLVKGTGEYPQRRRGFVLKLK